MDCFIGTILPWPIAYAPPYFALCQGQVLTVNQYQALYSLIGNIYGGPQPGTNFCLPDLRGRAIVGAGPYQGGAPLYQPGQAAGSATGSLTITQNNLPLHTHNATFVPVMGNVKLDIPAQPGSGSITVSSATVDVSTTAPSPQPTLSNGNTYYLSAAQAGGLKGPYTATAPAAGSTASVAGVEVALDTSTYQPAIPASSPTIQTVTNGQVAVQAGGGGNPQTPLQFNNMQPYLVMNFLMALQGLYPMRP